jgi:hypothetical protein
MNGEIIVRRALIKYIANKLGGAHLDHKRGTNHEETLYRLLDDARSWILMDKPAVYFELLAVGQAVAKAGDIGHLLSRRAKNSVP